MIHLLIASLAVCNLLTLVELRRQRRRLTEVASLASQGFRLLSDDTPTRIAAKVGG